MAGLFGLFGGKKKEENNSDKGYFLNNDDAKTFGNIDYMRETKKVIHTFPKTITGKGTKIEQEVSASAKTVTKNNQVIKSVVKSVESSAVTQTQSKTQEIVEKRRSSDNSLDMFRKMAKDLKK